MGRPFIHRMVFVVSSTGDAPTEEHAEKVKAGLEALGYTPLYVGEWLPGDKFPCLEEVVDVPPEAD